MEWMSDGIYIAFELGARVWAFIDNFFKGLKRITAIFSRSEI